ncbi:ACP S-malonyltransferase [Sanguibacter suarezii]|uniref:ACP S-malonyltransferase n=1 Tax=Sanguibacter suarezii TaxID=60921 RepID=UPI000A017ED6|nr:ACP S-malonyltransferase [Sanguibacter suarezii]
MFPGQGVQRRGMGAGLFAAFPDVTHLASDLLGLSIEELCTNDAGRQLRDTRYAQPAVFVVNMLMHLRHAQEHGSAYDYYAGHSLGEYNALVAAGVLTFDDALRVVVRRGELMSEIAGGGMSAILGVGTTVVERAIRDSGLTHVFVANRNAQTQTTIAGDRHEVSLVAKALADLPTVRAVPLNVSGPFHTPLMSAVEPALRTVLAECEFAVDASPVVSSVTGALFTPEDGVDLLGRQPSVPVEWVRAIATLRAAGVTYFDEANGKTLTALLH